MKHAETVESGKRMSRAGEREILRARKRGVNIWLYEDKRCRHIGKDKFVFRNANVKHAKTAESGKRMSHAGEREILRARKRGVNIWLYEDKRCRRIGKDKFVFPECERETCKNGRKRKTYKPGRGA